MIFCQKSVEFRTHLYKIVYKSEQERVLVIFSKTKLNTFSPPGAHFSYLFHGTEILNEKVINHHYLIE